LIASAALQAQPRLLLEQLGYECADALDPYSACAELAGRPQAYRAVIVSLGSVYKEELSLVGCIRRRWPGTEIWLTHTDGRHAALAQAMRMGADGLLAEDGLHRIGIAMEPRPEPTRGHHDGPPLEAMDELEIFPDEPVLTADELRALLQEQPSLPPSGDD
jgi:hypothetical protein